MDTNKLKRFATEARKILMQGVAHRLSALGFLPDGTAAEKPQQQGGGATFMGYTVTQDFYDKWQSLRRAVSQRSIAEVAEEAAYTWFNRLVAIRILVKNGLASPVLEYESADVLIPLLVSEARQGRMPQMDADSRSRLAELLDDDSKTSEQFALLIVAYCHENPIIHRCFGRITDYTELLLPTNILNEGGFVHLLNRTEFIAEADYSSPELIGWLYQFYIAERKDEVFAKKGKFEASEIPAATQIFTPNWIVKYMVQNTIGRIYLDNNPYEQHLAADWKYLVQPAPAAPEIINSKLAIINCPDLEDLKLGDLACGSGHILNECFDLLFQLYVEEGYSRRQAIESILSKNLTGIDLDTRAKQLAQFALLLKACQKDASFADAHCLPRVLDMPAPYVAESVCCNLDTACLKFMGGYEEVAAKMLEEDMELLQNADCLGSIMIFNDDEEYLAMLRYYYNEWTDGGIDDCPEEIRALLPGVRLILALTDKYHALVMNPPYMGGGNMNAVLAKYVKDNYEEGKADLFSVFMLVAKDRLLPNGKYGMINMQSWMFLSSFERLRTRLLAENRIDNMLHLGPRTFDELSGEVVQNTAFVITNSEGKNAAGSYYRLIEGKSCGDKERLFLEAQANDGKAMVDSQLYIVRYDNVAQHYFEKIPGCPIGYWVSENVIKDYSFHSASSVIDFKTGITTGDNTRFTRLWTELDNKSSKWVFLRSGASYRKWYGCLLDMVLWEDDGKEIKEMKSATLRNMEYQYKPCTTWSKISSGKVSMRYSPQKVMFDAVGLCAFSDKKTLYYCMALMNGDVGNFFLKITNASMSILTSDLGKVPFIVSAEEKVENIVSQNINISKQDWDAHETSWDFEENPLLAVDTNTYMENLQHETEQQTGEPLHTDPAPPQLDSLQWRMEQYKKKWEHLFMQLHDNEEELNRQFIQIYGLQDELSPDVPLQEITILQQGEVSIINNE